MVMRFVLQRWQLLLVLVAVWINRQQQEFFEHLRIEKSCNSLLHINKSR